MKPSFLTKAIAIGSIIATSTLAHAEFSGDNRIAFINQMPMSLQQIQGTLLQSVTNKRNSCGPTALLFISNHHRFVREGTNSPNMSSVTSSQRTLADMYSFIGKRDDSITSLDDLSKIAKQKFGWNNTKRMFASDGVYQNLNNLFTSLGKDYPVIAIVGARAPDYPLPESKTRIDHMVIIYQYAKQSDEKGRRWNDPNNTRNLDTITYYEPYYGRIKTVLRKDVSRTFNLAGFAYLQAGK